MDEETQKIVTEQMKQLPNDVKEAILSVDYKTKLQEITKRQRLLIDQAAKLEMETTLVMIGLEPLADYVGNLQKEMEVPVMRAKEIALDVSEHIFKPIRESLRTMNQEPGQEDEGKPKFYPSDGLVEDAAFKSTDSNEVNLNRDQILNEIENPTIINGGDRSMNFTKETAPAGLAKTTELEVRPAQELETIPGQEVKDLTADASQMSGDIIQNKMTGPTIISQQIVDNKTETKLPEIKKKPYGGTDPYREELK